MERWAAKVAYLGTAYHGWQRQQSLPTVQGVLEKALSSVANLSIETTCAGRTDAGVHATGQVVHWDAPVGHRKARQWQCGAHSQMPADIRLIDVRPVPSDFDARRSACSRTYRYRLLTTQVSSPFEQDRAWWHPHKLNASLMHDAAQALVGEHDFSSFRASGCQSLSPYRCILALSVYQAADMIEFVITANAFLYHMVRLIVGALTLVGQGKRSSLWLSEVLSAREYPLSSIMAPAHGLYLEHVDYPSDPWSRSE